MPHNKSFLIAIGANLPSERGSPAQTLQAAIENLQDTHIYEFRSSRFFRTPCFPAGAGPDYVNAAAAFQFGGTPTELLTRLHAIEDAFGRKREKRWGQRTLDLDLIAAGDQVLPDLDTHNQWRNLDVEKQQVTTPDELILPHPRLQDRAFVLVPLAEVAADWRHPVLGRTVREMRDALDPALLEEVEPF